MQQQVGRRLGVLDVAAVDDQRRLRQVECRYRSACLFGATGRGNRPSPPRLLEVDEKGSRASRWLGVRVDLVVDLARPLVDAFGGRLVECSAGALGNVARKPPAVGADQAGYVLLVRLDPLFGEDAQPRLDARRDGVDERAVEVEDECRRRRQRGERAQRRLRGTRTLIAPISAMPATPTAATTSLDRRARRWMAGAWPLATVSPSCPRP